MKFCFQSFQYSFILLRNIILLLSVFLYIKQHVIRRVPQFDSLALAVVLAIIRRYKSIIPGSVCQTALSLNYEGLSSLAFSHQGIQQILRILSGMAPIATSEQINALAGAGCDIVRCAVPDMESAVAFAEIKKRVSS